MDEKHRTVKHAESPSSSAASGCAVHLEAYHPVKLNLLRPDEIADFDIYLRPEAKGSYVLYRERCLMFAEAHRKRLEAAGVNEVYIHSEQVKTYQRYVERNLGAILDDAAVEPEQKADVLYGSMVGVVEDVLTDPRAGDMVARSRNMVENACTFLYREGGALEYIMRVCSFDYYTYTHSVNVFVFSMALGQTLFSRDHLAHAFGMGALLHDIGKSQLDPAIVNCKGKLTSEQFEAMKKHPVYGYEILHSKGNVPPLALDMTRHHHERLAGGGYPDNIKGDQIPREVRILTIADIFDALTTRRSYKDPINSFPALKMMREEMSDHIDMSLFRAFVKMMGKPAG